MEVLTGSRSNKRRLRVILGGKRERSCRQTAPMVEPDIVCLYGVVVQCTSVAGLELVEFEFLPDAA